MHGISPDHELTCTVYVMLLYMHTTYIVLAVTCTITVLRNTKLDSNYWECDVTTLGFFLTD